jgi:hypothetical protein
MAVIVKLIIAPFFLSVVFLIIAFDEVFAPSPSDRLYFIGASGIAACVGCFGIWIARGRKPPADSSSIQI